MEQLDFNRKLSEMLDRIADMLSVDERGTVRFEVRAYRKAALSIAELDEDVRRVYRDGGQGALMEIPGIGAGISRSIIEYIERGRMRKYEMLKRRYPIDFESLTKIEGLGPKRVVSLYRLLGVKDVAGLRAALDKHRIRGLKGFGERSEEAIGRGISMLESARGRALLGDALPDAEFIVDKLRASGLAERVEIAGSIRRMQETIGDIDILAASSRQEEVMDVFSKLDSVESVILRGSTKTSVRLRNGMNCDLRVIEPDSFGAALQYFTGNKYHNVSVRKIAIKRGYKLNEYGLFNRSGKDMARSRDERWIYNRLGMDYIPPEMREDRGEIGLALKHGISDPVELGDLRGDMHTHTRDSDGMNSIEEMAEAAIRSGLEYFATTNHTESLRIANGMNERGFAEYFKRVDALNDRMNGRIRVIKGAEVDILKDGSLDLSRKSLESMECVVASVHSSFNMDERRMTDRIVKAMDSGLVHILGHPTGRLIFKRDGYPIDLDKIGEAAERDGVAIEINSFPDRLDLCDTNIMYISKYKIRFAIDSDAHSVKHFSNLRYGVGTARRGWLTKDRILNCNEIKRLRLGR